MLRTLLKNSLTSSYARLNRLMESYGKWVGENDYYWDC
ncbi:hypothetical protein JOC55_005142 [Paenibacillus sacheonensis]|nr:hypothetical protein [Paenibacillus sacheonensis]